jgi:cytochrome c oxidase subunit 4
MSAPAHASPRATFVRVFVLLLVLTAVTAAVATADLGPLNVPIALAIAFLKAVLVALFFMQLRLTGYLTWLFAVIGLFWLGILVVLTLSDYVSRAWIPVLF